MITTPPTGSSLSILNEPEPVRNLPKRKRCGKCRKPLHVQKTRSRTVITRNGPVNVTEVSLHCPEHKEQVFHPASILTPPGSSYGFDVISDTGQLRCLEHKQIAEIKSEFNLHGITIPYSSVYSLSDTFLLYVVATHLESLPLLAQHFNQQGGYVLHVDGSGRHGPMVLLLKDSWSDIRLLAGRIPSEAAEYLSPYFRMVKRNFGTPVAVIRDMSKGIKLAATQLFPYTYIIICHYHFLRNVALMLFDSIYPRFRNMVDRRGVKGKLKTFRRVLQRRKTLSADEAMAFRLIIEILDYKQDEDGLAYPFSLPNVDFYRRCDEARVKVRTAILEHSKKNEPSPILLHPDDILRLLIPPPIVLGKMRTDFESLNVRWQWFQRIRRALRYRNGPIPLSTQITLSEKDLEKGRKKLDWVIWKIDEFDEHGDVLIHDRKLRKDLRKVKSSIEEHRNELFAPNVLVKVDGKELIKRLPRTNSPEEMDFRMVRRHGRRIRGNQDIEPQFQRDGPGLLIALNLTNPEYVKIVYGRLENMEARFSRVSPKALKLAKSLMAGLHQ